MSPDEVIATLQNYGINITRRTLLRYESNDLLPKPKRGGDGRGKGRFTVYPQETPLRFYIAYSLLHNRVGYPIDTPIRQIQQTIAVISGEERPDNTMGILLFSELYAQWNFFLDLYNEGVLYSKENTYSNLRIECNSCINRENILEYIYKIEMAGTFQKGFGASNNFGNARYIFISNYLNSNTVFVVERDLERQYSIVAEYCIRGH